jgi:hypothetical protein
MNVIEGAMNSIYLIIIGICEGICAPIAEGCISIIISSLVTMNQIIQSTSIQINPHSQSISSYNLDLGIFLLSFSMMTIMKTFYWGYSEKSRGQ